MGKSLSRMSVNPWAKIASIRLPVVGPAPTNQSGVNHLPDAHSLGARGSVGSVGHGTEMAATIPGGQLIVLDDCGHLPTLGQPDATVAVAVIRSFEVGPRGRDPKATAVDAKPAATRRANIIRVINRLISRVITVPISGIYTIRNNSEQWYEGPGVKWWATGGRRLSLNWDPVTASAMNVPWTMTKERTWTRESLSEFSPLARVGGFP